MRTANLSSHLWGDGECFKGQAKLGKMSISIQKMWNDAYLGWGEEPYLVPGVCAGVSPKQKDLFVAFSVPIQISRVVLFVSIFESFSRHCLLERKLFSHLKCCLTPSWP
ncbi:UNVERIFIED_CONTAM: hypothetical protein K2H54_013389 [Gekko kuhli]